MIRIIPPKVHFARKLGLSLSGIFVLHTHITLFSACQSMPHAVNRFIASDVWSDLASIRSQLAVQQFLFAYFHMLSDLDTYHLDIPKGCEDAGMEIFYGPLCKSLPCAARLMGLVASQFF